MKFSDGYWQMRQGVHASYPAVARHVTAADGELTVHAPVRPVRHRGDTLQGPLLTVTCTAPMRGVIGVRVGHLAGKVDRGPHFPLRVQGTGAGEARYDDDAATLTSGDLTVRVERRDGWRVDFTAGGGPLTSSGSKALAAVTTDDGRHFVREQLDLGPADHVYGLGERFGPLVKNGQVVDIWNADGGTSSEQAYKNVPFYLTDAGYGVFVDHPGLVSFEVASEVVSRVGFSVEGQWLQYYVIHGPTPKEILRRYTALTGRPALPPAWSFGLWLSTSFTTSYDEQTVSGFVDGMAERDIPLNVFHFDCFWMREYRWCDFEWDPEVFPDPAGMLARLKARGLHICVWINPYIAQLSPLFAEGKQRGYLLKRPNGDVWQTDDWQPGMALVDFTNPGAREWYAGKLRALLDTGVDCFKTDFGERVPTDVEYFDGSDPERMHNYYTYLYNETVFELLRRHRGDGEAVLFARSATAGTQQFPVHWGGDCESTFPSMAESLRGGLSLSSSGFGFWSHDIGGFEGMPDPAVFKRWVAFGLLSSHSRLHGSSSYRVPWLFDDEAVEVLRRFTRLKARLMPYLYEAARQAHETGVPVMRAMALEFPDDPACPYLDRQYLLGDDLLVAPVFSPDGDVSYYVPAGTWTHLLTGERVRGPAWVRETHDVDSVPLLVRPGAVVPVGARADRADYDYRDGVTLLVHAVADGARVETAVPTTAGAVAATFVTTRSGDRLQVRVHDRVDDATAAWRVLLVGIGADELADVDGAAVIGAGATGETAGLPPGVLLRAEPGLAALRVTLSDPGDKVAP